MEIICLFQQTVSQNACLYFWPFTSAGNQPWAAQFNLVRALEGGHRWIIGLGRYVQYNWAEAESVSNTIFQDSRQLSVDWQYEQEAWQWQAAVYANRATFGAQAYRILGGEGQLRYRAKRFRAWLAGSSVRSRLGA